MARELLEKVKAYETLHAYTKKATRKTELQNALAKLESFEN